MSTAVALFETDEPQRTLKLWLHAMPSATAIYFHRITISFRVKTMPGKYTHRQQEKLIKSRSPVRPLPCGLG